jgi:hypothetical protein
VKLELRIVRALRECNAELAGELFAAGEDEVKRHPLLQKKMRIHVRTVKLLAEWDAAQRDKGESGDG